MEQFNPIFYLNILGYKFGVTQSLLIQWIIMIILSIAAIYLSSNIKTIPDKKQSMVEIFIGFINKLVEDNMGSGYKGFVPFIGTMSIFILLMNFTGLFGFKPPTVDYSVALGLAFITFVVIQGYTIKKIGVMHYFIGYGEPYLFLLPTNVIERFMLPISLSLRLFGNMTAAVVIMDLVYGGLRNLSFFAQLGIPIPLHLYFDLFDGSIQTVIFIMLTMINIKIVSEH